MEKFNKNTYLMISILFILDQGTKVIIKNYLMDKEIEMIGDLILFKPVLNLEFSWVNAVLGLGVGLIGHLILALLIGALLYCVYKYLSAITHRSEVVRYGFAILVAGYLCALSDKLFFGGSLDFIKIRGLFTCDLKDLYLVLAQIIFMSQIILNWNSLKGFKMKAFWHVVFSKGNK
jgi:signal peptidase II